MNRNFVCKFLIIGIILAASPVSAGGDGDIDAGKIKSSACSSCHGLNGQGVGANPPLVGIDSEDLIDLMQAYKTGEKTEPIMTMFMQALSDEDIANLAAYYASLPNTQ